MGIFEIISSVIFPTDTARRKREELEKRIAQLEEELEPSDEENERLEQESGNQIQKENQDGQYFRADGIVTAWNQIDGIIDEIYMFSNREVERSIIERLQKGSNVVYWGEKTEDAGIRVLKIEKIKDLWEENDVSSV